MALESPCGSISRDQEADAHMDWVDHAVRVETRKTQQG